ncbi:restriction endonuclease subunit S, partial [Chromohalobacter sp. 296-RDG]|uniref:restriction endonuclease subunit S n=1 Tax=Chromohalobacter sp. 296-RDG TaxID=2994062 RepID=UPI0024696EED
GMSEWVRCQLSDVCDFFIGGTPSRNQPEFWATPPSGSPWLAISDLKSKFLWRSKEHITELGALSSNVKIIPPDSTVMSFKLSIGRAGITKTSMYCNEAIAFFKPIPGELDSRWLYHAIPRAADKVVTDSAVKGATLNKKKIAEIPLHLPPLDEQVGVAEVLDTLDTQIQKTEALIAKLEKVKEGLLHDLLTRGIDESGRLRPSPVQAPELYKESPLGLIPKPWDTSKLSELILEHNSGLYTPKSNYGRGTPMLGVSSLYSIDVLQNQELRKAPIPSSMLEKYTLQEGDIVYGESSLVLSGIAKTVAVGELGEGKGFEWHTRRIRVNKDTA